MVKVELITIPGSGTRSIERFLTKEWNFELFNYPFKNEEQAQKPMVFTSTHFEPDRRSMDRLLRTTDVLILSTWRDPLRTVIHNVYKGRKHIMMCFAMLQELRAARPVMMVDLNCLPYQEGAGEILHPMSRVANDNHALRDAYFRKDIAYIDGIIPDYLKQLREFDFGNLPVEEWWR